MKRHRLLPLCALLGVLFAGLLPNLEAQEVFWYQTHQASFHWSSLLSSKHSFEDCAQGLGADIYFLVDSSWSMGVENFKHIRQFLYSLIQSLHQVGGERFKFALVQYNTKPQTEFQLNSYPTTQGVLAHIKAMPYRGGGTQTGLGLDFLTRTHLTTASGSRAVDGVAQVVVVLTDGRSQDDVAEPAQVLWLAGVEVFAVGVQDAVDSELRDMASKPHDTHVFSVDSFLTLRDIIQDLVVGLCDTVTRSGGGPVANEAPVSGGGTAQDSADLVLLIDGSENVGAANFPFVRDLVLRIIEPLDVGRDTVRVALALYNGNPQIKFYLNSYDSKSSVLEAVKGLSYSGGDESNLGFALEEVAKSLLSQTAGGRADEGVPQMMVVISAGPSTDDTGAGDRALKRAGVITLGVTIGDTASADLEAVATDKSFVLSAPDFRTVVSTGDRLLPLINGVVQRTIIVQTEFTEVLAVGPRDIIFLIDSTMGATLINSVQEFIKRFVDIIPIGPDGVQVGVAKFSNVPQLQMDLNSYGSREELTAALGSIKPRPGQTVNIGAALDFVRTNMLRPEKGSRIQQGVPQLLLLMTSKKSSDSVEAPAKALQRLGVLTLAAGSKTATENELRQIAFADTVAFYLKDFRSLLRNPKAIVDALSTLAGVVVTEGPTKPVVEITTVQTQNVVRDIVFLVDGSNYVGSSNFPYVRDFIINVVNQLDVRPDRVRIGLLQFAESQKIEFHLNSYSSRQDVVNQISQLRLTGGSVLNTGAAMNYALSKMFQPSTGSRRKQGVQQVLVLITGGPVQDQAKNAADKLALAGVLTFTVSSGEADEALMKSVAFVEDLAYHETSFSNLPALAGQIMPKLITVVGDTDVTETTFPEETAQDSADLVLLIDGSENVGAANFPFVRDLVLRIIEPLDVGRDTVRVALALYNGNPQIKFYLNSYDSKSSVLEAVKGLSYSGGDESNLGFALEEVTKSLLSQTAGGRANEGVPQMMVVISAGPSTDDTGAGDRALKRAGVITVGVAIGDTASADLEAVATDKSFVLSAPDFRTVVSTGDRLLPLINGVVQRTIIVQTEFTEVLAVGPRDIIFLIDSTMGATLINSVREFIKRFVNIIPIGPDGVQVGVAQFSNIPQLQMDLNSYGSREELTAALGSIKPRPGQTVNIGAALDFVRTNMLRPEKGSRIQQGVPQLLLLMTSKKSSDSVEAPAKALQRLGVIDSSCRFQDCDGE
ncbi:collagen alpha-3(VI) chain-like [Perca fluviatilis]|uniref:collagen alpha-3(VI) chain-like n=1 Tax=Perca fluviatilis TaxID=8168 RepID=UPI0019628D83|nr:collagen alpha-3(VI) chain-like [Perca fluviatilis]